jgi:2,4-dienoyl-CoA reductase-like NADH-dependent reductase (Old Yellow Enzyme family)/thioredoxin reductase
MNQYSHVFQPLKIRHVLLKNRLEFTPFVCSICDAEGGVIQATIDFLARQARTGVANIVIGNIVDPDRSMNCYADLDFMHDQFIAGLSLLADEAHRYGAKLAYEVCHSGRGNIPSLEHTKTARDTGITAAKPVPQMELTVNHMTRADMDWMIERFVGGCLRSKKAGFDMIFLHAGHNNLLGSFLSPGSNRRQDEYGGSMTNRMRFPLEMVKAIRAAIGADMPIEVRVSASELTEHGATMKEALAFLKEAEPYIDIAHFSCGNVFDDNSRRFTSPMYTMEHLQNVKYAAQAKKVLRIPVTVVGNIFTVADAEAIIAAGQADLVGMCRSLLADPELIHKALSGREAAIRPCLRCMDGCGRIFNGFPVRCAINPTLGRETQYKVIPRAASRKRVMVIGGGPAGMQAVQTLTQRGHAVTLYEKSGQLGGLLNDAAAVSFKHLMRNYRDWDVRTTMNCGATIKLNTEVTPELVAKEGPDAVIIATGSVYIKPPLKGIEGRNIHMLRDVEGGAAPIGRRVIVCGGGLSGVECAVDLARRGKDVTVIDQIPTEDFCKDMFFFAYEALFAEVGKSGVRLQGGSRILEFNNLGVVVERDGRRIQMEADAVIIALGLQAQNNLAEKLLPLNPLNTYVVGDADGVKNIRKANYTAFNCAMEI